MSVGQDWEDASLPLHPCSALRVHNAPPPPSPEKVTALCLVPTFDSQLGDWETSRSLEESLLWEEISGRAMTCEDKAPLLNISLYSCWQLLLHGFSTTEDNRDYCH